MSTADRFIREFSARGKYHFTTREAQQALGSSAIATRAVLRRLKEKGIIASPHRGFHLIIPPEYQRIGSLPADQFIPQLMHHCNVPYYAGILSAARYHGAAHQQPQLFQVVVPKNRPAIHCGQINVEFIARANAFQMPTVEFNTPRGSIRVSSPEATAFDLVGYPGHAGGLDNVLTVLQELVEKLKASKLAQLALLSPKPWTQRLGYLLDLAGAGSKTDKLAKYVTRDVTEPSPLQPDKSTEQAKRNQRWKLLINADLEPDL